MSKIQRRDFVGGACASLAAAAMIDPTAVLAGNNDAVLQPFNKVMLAGLDGKPLKAASLKDGESFVFSYPYVSSPAYIINTGVELKAAGKWGGGLGPKKSIVALAAICTHLLSHPTKDLATITYRHKKQGFFAKKDHVMTCCTHGSVFDLERAGTRIDGPARAALSLITLEHDAAADTLSATGVYGVPWLHKKFLKNFKKDLRKIYGRSGYKKLVEGTTAIKNLKDVSADVLKC